VSGTDTLVSGIWNAFGAPLSPAGGSVPHWYSRYVLFTSELVTVCRRSQSQGVSPLVIDHQCDAAGGGQVAAAVTLAQIGVSIVPADRAGTRLAIAGSGCGAGCNAGACMRRAERSHSTADPAWPSCPAMKRKWDIQEWAFCPRLHARVRGTARYNAVWCRATQVNA